MSEIRCDVVVVGAGPAGSATAIFLARRGYDVLLLDRASFPRGKPCGEFLSPGSVALLGDKLGVLPELLAEGAMPLDSVHVVAHDGRSFGGPSRAAACPRSVTDNVLRRAAAAAGARVQEGVTVRRILFEGSRVAGVAGVDSTGAPLVCRARVTVGADGTRSLLARSLGLVRPIPRLHRIALVGHFPLSAGVGPQNSVLMFLPRDRSDACCGVGPVCGSERRANINIVVPLAEAPAMAGRRREYFAERLARSFPQVWDQVRAGFPAATLESTGCFGHQTERAVYEGAVLVGDAATFINPFTGEGVFFALRGAQMAAETIAAALASGATGQSDLWPYEAARRRELQPRYRLCDAVQKVVHSPTLLHWATTRLRRSAGLTGALLQVVGDLARPASLLAPATLRLALQSL